MLAFTYKSQHWMLPSPIQSNTTVSVPSQHPMLRFVRNCQHILYEVLHMLAFTYILQHWMLPSPIQSNGSTLPSLQCLVYRSIQCCNLYVIASIYYMRYYICQLLRTFCSIGCCNRPDTAVMAEQNHQTRQERAASNAAKCTLQYHTNYIDSQIGESSIRCCNQG